MLVTSINTATDFSKSIIDDYLNGISRVAETPLLPPEFYQLPAPSISPLLGDESIG